MTRRTDRVAEALQALVAELLLREIKDPRIGLVTITGVKLSPDLRNARVYFSRLGGESERAQSLKGLNSAAIASGIALVAFFILAALWLVHPLLLRTHGVGRA